MKLLLPFACWFICSSRLDVALSLTALPSTEATTSFGCSQIIVLKQGQPHFDVVLAENLNDVQNHGVQVEQLVGSHFFVPAHVSPGIAVTGTMSFGLEEGLGRWQYKVNESSTWTDFPADVSESNAVLIPKSGSIRYAAPPGYSNVPGIDVSRPLLTFYGWDGIHTENITFNAVCNFSMSSITVQAVVISLNYVQAVDVMATSVTVEIALSLCNDMMDGHIVYEVLLPDTCVAQSVTDSVQMTFQGGILSKTIQLLQHATQYIPRIKVFAANGSQIIEEVGDPVTTQEGVPDFVRNLDVITTANSSVVTISWKPPLPPFQRGVIKYYVVVIDGREQEVIPPEFSNGNPSPVNDGFVVNVTGITLMSLESSSWFSVRVAAATAVGVGPFSKPFSFKTEESQVPSRPSFVRIFQAGHEVIVVQWGYPRHPGGVIQNFVIELYDGPFNIPDFPDIVVVRRFVAAANERYHVFHNVSIDDVHVTVQARNRRGLGNVGRSKHLGLRNPPNGLIIQATNVSKSSAALSWSFPSGPGPSPPPESHLNILLFPDDNCRRKDPRNDTMLNSLTSMFEARDLRPFTVYTVCLWRSSDPFSSSSLAFFITNQATPGPMSDVHDGSLLMSKVAKTDSVLVKWQPVPHPNGVISYEISVRKETDSLILQNIKLNPNLLPPPLDSYYRWRVFGLEGDVKYIFTVRPFNLLDNSTGSEKPMYSSTDVGIPGTPVFTNVNVTTSSVTVRWDSPSEWNGDLGAYNLSIFMANISTSRLPQYLIRQQLASVNPGVREYTFNNLMPNTSYATVVRARNDGGVYGEWSSPHFAATLAPVSPTSLVLVTSETPSLSNPCDFAICSDFAYCSSMDMNAYNCSCLPDFVGDGNICIHIGNLSTFVTKFATSVNVTVVMFGGDSFVLNNTAALFDLLTPNGQLVQTQQVLFQIVMNKFVVATAFFQELQSGVAYIVDYSIPIGLFILTDSFETATNSSIPRAPPSDVNVTHITNSSASVFWTPPPRAFNNGPLIRYRVMVQSVFAIEGSFVNRIVQTPRNTTYIELERLFPFQRYVVSVAAVNEAGTGPWSDEGQFITSSTRPGMPHIDNALGLFNGSEYVVYVSWRYPDIPGAAISHYRIEAVPVNGRGGPTESNDVDALENFVLLKNLSSSTSYTLTVQAATNSSLGLKANHRFFPDDSPQPGFSMPESVSVGDVAETDSGHFNVTVMWPAVNVSSIDSATVDATVKYQIVAKLGKKCSQSRGGEIIVELQNTSVVISGLQPNSLYSICVAVMVNGEISYDSATTIVVTPQTAPGGDFEIFQVHTISSTSASVTWLLLSLLQNDVVGYRVTATDVSSGSLVSSVTIKPSELVTSSGDQRLGLLLRGLTEDDTYDVSVSAYNLKNGRRGSAVTKKLVTLVGAPQPPRDVAATPSGQDSIKVSWSPSLSTDVVAYHITSVLANSSMETTLPDYFISRQTKSVSELTLEYSIHHLEPNTRYAMWVEAVNRAGVSRPSKVVFQTTEGPIVGRCVSNKCSFFAQCLPDDQMVFHCTCAREWIGNGSFCVGLPEITPNATKTSIHVSVVVSEGDIQALSGQVYFEVYTPDNQLVAGIRSSMVAAAKGNRSTALMVVGRLQSGVNYTVRYSFNVESFPFVGELYVQTLASLPTMPPTNVTASWITSSSAVISWLSPPQAFTNGPVKGYKVVTISLFAIDGVFVRQSDMTEGEEILSIYIEKLASFQPYLVSVAAINDAGRGPWSEAHEFATNETVPGRPHIDESETAMVMNGSMPFGLVTWDYPRVPGALVTGFYVKFVKHQLERPLFDGEQTSGVEPSLCDEEQTSGVQLSRCVSAADHRLVVPLSQNTGYLVDIRTASHSVTGPSDNSYIDGGACSYSLQESPAMPESIHATYWMSASGNVTITVSWSPVNVSVFPENSTLKIQISYAENERCCFMASDDTTVDRTVVVVDINETESVIPGLFPDSLYSICVGVVLVASEINLSYSETIVVVPTSAPGQVENATLIGVDDNSVNVVWLPPWQQNGVIGYLVTAEDVDTKTLVSQVVLTPSQIISGQREKIGAVLEGLTGNRSYEISVQAFNLKHNYIGKPVLLREKTLVGRPRQVVSVDVVKSTSRSITIRWFSPSITNGRVVYYEVTSAMANATQGNELPLYFTSVQTSRFDGSTFRYKIIGLQPSTRYAITVSAATGAGRGPASPVVFAVTQASLSTCDLNCLLSGLTNTRSEEFTTQFGRTVVVDTIEKIENETLAVEQLQTAIDIVDGLVTLQEEALRRGLPLSPSDSYVDLFLELSSNLLNSSREDTWLALNTSSGAPQFLGSMERYGRVTAATYASNSSSPRTFSTNNIVLAFSIVTQSTAKLGVSFSPDEISLHQSLSYGQLTVSSSLLESLLSLGANRLFVSSVFFQSLHQYMPSDTSLPKQSVAAQRDSSNELPSTVLVSASIVEEISGQQYDPSYSTQTLPEPITISYSNVEFQENVNYTCSFWQFATNTIPGQWSSSGVTTNQISSTDVLCTSTHLTSFSVLVSVQDAATADALTYITYIGCGISLLCLLITLGFLVFFRSSLLPERNFININLIVALILALVFFLAGIDQSSNRDVCKAMTLIMHYFFLAVFCWMLCEGVLLYLLLVVVFDSGKTYAKRYFAFGWGLPVVIVAISFGVRYDEYGAYDYCFLTHHKGLIYAFIAPMGAILLINLVVFVIAMKLLLSKVIGNRSTLSVVKSGLRGMGILLPVLGLTWSVGVFAVDTLSLPLAYIFTILNSLQGVFIFMFHCVLNEQIRKAIRTKRKKRQQLKSLEKSTGTSGVGTGHHHKGAGKKKHEGQDHLAPSSIGMHDIEHGRYRRIDMDHAGSVSTQVTTLKVESTVTNADSMTSVRSDEPLRGRSGSLSANNRSSPEDSPGSSPKLGVPHIDLQGEQEDQKEAEEECRTEPHERPDNEDVVAPVDVLIEGTERAAERAASPSSPKRSDSQSLHSVEAALPLVDSVLDEVSSLNTLESVDAVDIMVFPRELSDAVIVRQGSYGRIVAASERPLSASESQTGNELDVRSEMLL